MRIFAGVPFAVAGPCLYLVALPLPFRGDFALIILGLCGVLALADERGAQPARELLLPTFLFVASIGISCGVSVDPLVSLQLSAAILPAALVFYLITHHFRNIESIRAVYVGCSLLALEMSVMLIAEALRNVGGTPTAWIEGLSSPALSVPNDAVLLALVAPFNIALVRRSKEASVRILAVLSLLLSLVAICLLQSRTGALAFILATVLAFGFERPAVTLPTLLATVVIVLAVDTILGSPVTTKFVEVSDARIWLWLAAWDMFQDAPWLGHGSGRTNSAGSVPVLVGPSFCKWAPTTPGTAAPGDVPFVAEVRVNDYGLRRRGAGKRSRRRGHDGLNGTALTTPSTTAPMIFV